MQTKKLYIIGAGGFGREVAWLVERINSVEPTWDLQGFIDDNKAVHGLMEGGYPVVGGCDFLEKCKEEIWVVCAIGAAAVRKLVVEKVKGIAHVKFATLIDPSAMMSSRVSLGEGCIICAGNIFTVDISIGNHVIVNLDCTIGHDAMIKDFVTIYPGVHVSGNVIAEECVELGTGTQIIQGKKIENGTIVGAGAVVTKDLPGRCTAVGAPAKPIKFFDERV